MASALSSKTARAYSTNESKAPAYWMIGVLWRVLATGIQTGGSFCLLDQLCSAGSGPTCHKHPQDEGLYVVSGSVSFQAGGLEFVAGPGSFVSVPRHTEHSFVADHEANLLNFYLPAGFDLFLMGSAPPAESNALPPADLPMPPRAPIEGLSKDYGGLPLTQDRSTRSDPDAAATPVVTSAATADAYWHVGGRWAVLASGASTGGSYCMFEVIMPRDAEITPHVRDDVDEVFFVLEGSADMLLDDRIESMRQGSMVFAPRGTVAALRVTSATARLLIIHTVPGYERVLACFGTKATASGLPGAGYKPLETSEQRVRDLHADIGLRQVIGTDWSAARRQTVS